jgi:hypothetical protein
MGQELECTARWNGRSLAGKAYLETEFVLFRGTERVKIGFKELESVTADAGVLRLSFPGGVLELELGKAAEKWRGKILHPPSRLSKLGVGAGVRVKVVGAFESDFEAELRASACELDAETQRRRGKRGEEKFDLVLFSAGEASELAEIAELKKAIQSDGALWVVYPKGVKVIREMDVLGAGRAAGLKDVKVASFSATHTALKFVVPLAKR